MIQSDTPSWINHLGLNFFLKRIIKKGTIISQEVHEMYKVVNFWELMGKTEKNTELSKKIISFGQTYIKLTWKS